MYAWDIDNKVFIRFTNSKYRNNTIDNIKYTNGLQDWSS